jgi:putative serine/threonine protein kinase
MEYLAKGKRGIVYTTKRDGRTVLVKVANPDAGVDTIAYEAEMLQIVNKHGIGPQFIEYKDGRLVREFIDGKEIGDWIAAAKKPAIIKVLLDIVAQCKLLDDIGINKQEMTHPHKHILVSKSNVFFIDFERARRTQRPKNITQICQWLSSTDLASLLGDKGIIIPRDAMREHARMYAKDRHAYRRIVEVIRNA